LSSLFLVLTVPNLLFYRLHHFAFKKRLKLASSIIALHVLQTIGDLQQTMEVRTSNLGELVDDVEEEKEKLREYEDRVVQLEQIANDKNKQVITKSWVTLPDSSDETDY